MKSAGILFFVLLLLSCKPETEKKADTGILIDEIYVLNPDQDHFIEAYVIIEGDLIREIGIGKYPSEWKATRIEGKGKYLVPGLIDSQVDLSLMSGIPDSVFPGYEAWQKSFDPQLLKSFLYYGFTTLIDHDLSPERLADLESLPGPKPSVYSCSGQLKLPADSSSTDSVFTRGKRTAENAVLDIRSSGGICAMMVFNDGALSGGGQWNLPTQEYLRSIAESCQKIQIPFLISTNSYAGQRFSFGAGAEIFTNGMWTWGTIEEFEDQFELPDTHRLLLYAISATGTGYQPALRIPGSLSDLYDSTFGERNDLSSVYSDSMIRLVTPYQEEISRQLLENYFPGLDEYSDAEIREIIGKYRRRNTIALNIVEERKGEILLGTGTVAGWNPGSPPGLNGYLEMKEWAECGILPSGVLRAATISNAKAFHLDEEIGSIAPGMRADLLILGAHPFESIESWNLIETVIAGGIPIQRNELSAQSSQND